MTVPASAWGDLEALGGFFAVEHAGPDGDWQPVAAGVRSVDDLAARAHIGRRAIAARSGVPLEAVDHRATVSVVTQGIVARLVSPAVGLALVHGLVPHLGSLQWDAPSTGPLRLRVTGVVAAVDVHTAIAEGADRPDAAAAALMDQVVHPLVEPLLASAQALGRLAPSLLRGNLTSALAGAAQGVSRTFPELVPASDELVAALLQVPALQLSGRLSTAGFRRRTCCLYYRFPGGGTCGDCPLREPAEPARTQGQ